MVYSTAQEAKELESGDKSSRASPCAYGCCFCTDCRRLAIYERLDDKFSIWRRSSSDRYRNDEG